MTSFEVDSGLSLNNWENLGPVSGCVASKVIASSTVNLPENEFIKSFLLGLIRNPDPGSKFEVVSKELQEVPDAQTISQLLSQRYDALIYHAGEVLGHAAFQLREGAIYMFSVGVAEQFRGNGLSRSIMSDLIEHGKILPEVSEIHLGDGGHPVVQGFCETVAKFEEYFGLKRVSKSGFKYLDK